MAKKTIIPQTEAPRSRARAPSRERGFLRYNALLDATDALLSETAPHAIGLYQIAERADVPPASVYHFFPTKDAALEALAKRYLVALAAQAQRPVRAERLKSWQDLLSIEHERAVDFYNKNPTAMLLFLGRISSPEVDQIDIGFETALAAAMFGRYDAVFHMPHIGDSEKRFEICWAIADAAWAISYRVSKSIRPDYATEALDACLAYCRLFLPAQVELREPYLTAAKEHQEVSLPAPPNRRSALGLIQSKNIDG